MNTIKKTKYRLKILFWSFGGGTPTRTSYGSASQPDFFCLMCRVMPQAGHNRRQFDESTKTYKSTLSVVSCR